jgi:hypothetical protein
MERGRFAGRVRLVERLRREGTHPALRRMRAEGYETAGAARPQPRPGFLVEECRVMSTRLRCRPRLAARVPQTAAAPGAWFRLRAGAGIAGPAALTAAWVSASLLQTGHSAAQVQISGLAAPDARYPWIMITGFIALGGCSVAFGSALQQALGGAGRAGPAPRLIQAAGVLTVAAGLLRRDSMLLTAPAGESWHNQAHDVISIPVYLALVAAPLLLAWRFRGDRRFRALRAPLTASAVASAAVLAVFASPAVPSWDAVLQRIAVSMPLAAMAAVALRLATLRQAALRQVAAGPEMRG